jgi:hypothetical protein
VWLPTAAASAGLEGGVVSDGVEAGGDAVAVTLAELLEQTCRWLAESATHQCCQAAVEISQGRARLGQQHSQRAARQELDARRRGRGDGGAQSCHGWARAATSAACTAGAAGAADAGAAAPTANTSTSPTSPTSNGATGVTDCVVGRRCAAKGSAQLGGECGLERELSQAQARRCHELVDLGDRTEMPCSTGAASASAATAAATALTLTLLQGGNQGVKRRAQH